jgi:2-polyprenyl-6-methoxyphenol hydroxylase-like FAD-dependent oxidoreductase
MSSSTEPAHVAIIGAGPAGALTAFLLVRMGIRVTLIERHSDFSREFRGEGMTPGGMAAIREAGLWTAFDALPSEPIRRLQMFAGGRRFLALDMQAILPGDAEFIRLVAQPKLLEMLVAQCSAHQGFSLRRGTVVRSLIMEQERVAGVLVGSDGGETAIAADYVIAADGRFSVARKRLGLELEGGRQEFDVVWCRVPRSAPVERGMAYSFLLDDYFGLAFPADEDHVQIGRIIAKGSYRAFRGEGEEAWKDHLADVLPPPLAELFAETRDRATDPFLLDVICGMLPKWSVPGLVMLGDAAHPMSPVGAQGINIALRDAIILANHLGPALLAGQGPPALDTAAQAFEAERRPEVARIQAEQNAATKRLARIEAMAPFIRLIPSGPIASIGRFLLKRPAIRRFIDGAARIELTFKPEGSGP